MAKRKQPKVRQRELVTLPPKRLKDATGRIVDVPERKVWMSAEMAANHRSTAELIGALKTGNGIAWEDLERHATNPPMTAQRLLSIILALHDLKAEEWAKVRRAAGRAQTHDARAAANKAAVTQPDGRDWRVMAREIETAGDPRSGKPWASRERLITHLMEKFNKSRSAVIRALSNNPG